ncbi:30S ribosomal protein S21 [Candidatus Peregrinibacteria bacterium CG22_combo_CG10-13_8_21_14_all_49_11]|nr:MAG: 30S ribosomal protein S21 [Candidatus Peregrinibacteria bacterium CG22_combo_CG10-13_8_21_14_all_49_11]
MAIFARKKQGESNDSLQQRFKKQVQKSGVLALLRKRSVHSKKRNRLIRRKRALHRENLRAENKKRQFYSAM